MVKMTKNFLYFFGASLLLFGSMTAQSHDEEMEDYFKKWLDEDVLYTITDDEKVVFKKLQTTEEKERFIEQFWTRRDPSPRSSYNEFKRRTLPASPICQRALCIRYSWLENRSGNDLYQVRCTRSP